MKIIGDGGLFAATFSIYHINPARKNENSLLQKGVITQKMYLFSIQLKK